MADRAERRRSQRVDANLPLKIFVDGGGQDEAAGLETINISTSGVYFRSGRFFAPMTKLALGLELAVPGDHGGDRELALVQCEGLVVRSQPEEETAGAEYEVAVFFTWIEAEGQAILEEHINLLLADS
jgi:hypothetical protein